MGLINIIRIDLKKLPFKTVNFNNQCSLINCSLSKIELYQLSLRNTLKNNSFVIDFGN